MGKDEDMTKVVQEAFDDMMGKNSEEMHKGMKKLVKTIYDDYGKLIVDLGSGSIADIIDPMLKGHRPEVKVKDGELDVQFDKSAKEDVQRSQEQHKTPSQIPDQLLSLATGTHPLIQKLKNPNFIRNLEKEQMISMVELLRGDKYEKCKMGFIAMAMQEADKPIKDRLEAEGVDPEYFLERLDAINTAEDKVDANFKKKTAKTNGVKDIANASNVRSLKNVYAKLKNDFAKESPEVKDSDFNEKEKAQFNKRYDEALKRRDSFIKKGINENSLAADYLQTNGISKEEFSKESSSLWKSFNTGGSDLEKTRNEHVMKMSLALSLKVIRDMESGEKSATFRELDKEAMGSSLEFIDSVVNNIKAKRQNNATKKWTEIDGIDPKTRDASGKSARFG